MGAENVNDRAKLIEKIRALLAKTTERGCTEEETLAAIAKAQALMDAYEVTDEEVEATKGETASIHEAPHHDPHRIRRWLLHPISKFCGVEAWHRGKNSRAYTTIGFCGLAPDVDFANWLLDSLGDFVRSELAKFLLRRRGIGPADKRRAINGFVLGCVHKIGARLRSLAPAASPTSARQALVVVKDGLIAAAMTAAGVEVRTARAGTHRVEDGALAAGMAAGERASFSRPIDAAGATLLIGGRIERGAP